MDDGPRDGDATARSSMGFALGVTVLMALLAVAVRGGDEPIV